ncbi:hypothetical protein OAO01_07230 [Oligoflexia bacterium]|nr:hypothetical protein [Oligoflexia bacterium]
MSNPRKHELVLGLYPNTRGFAFALFESPASAVDWGLVDARGEAKNRECLRRISILFGKYEPSALVLQDTSETVTRRSARIRDLHEAIAVLAETQGIPVFSYSREQTRKIFSSMGGSTKQLIAQAIGEIVPAFGNFIPPPRKAWNSEHSRMALFDAAALVVTLYHSQSDRP